MGYWEDRMSDEEIEQRLSTNPDLSWLQTEKRHRAERRARIAQASQAPSPSCSYMGCTGTLEPIAFNEYGEPQLWRCTLLHRHGGPYVEGSLGR